MLKARAAVAAGCYEDAWRILRTVADEGRGQEHAEALVEMGTIKERQGGHEEAIKLFMNALARSDDSLFMRLAASSGRNCRLLTQKP